MVTMTAHESVDVACTACVCVSRVGICLLSPTVNVCGPVVKLSCMCTDTALLTYACTDLGPLYFERLRWPPDCSVHVHVEYE